MRTPLQETERKALAGDAESVAAVVKALRQYRVALAAHNRAFDDAGKTTLIIQKIENLVT